MLEESSGYFWFATDMGVSRYNGYEFKNYTTEDGLPDNTVFGIYEDRKHNIWFRTLSGKLGYFKNDKITTLPVNDTLSKLISNLSITSIYVDKNDTIWLGLNSNFLVKIYPGWDKHSIRKINMPFEGEYICEIEDGFIYGGNCVKFSNIYVYRKHKEIYRVNIQIKNKPLDVFRHYATRLSNGSYLACINNLLVNFNRHGILNRWGEETTAICAWEDNDNGILIGTYSGAFVRNRKLDELTDLTEKFAGKVITAIHRDKENELWICTKGHGVFYIPYQNFKYYTNSNGLSESSISTIGDFGEEVVSGHLSGEICFLKKNSVETVRLLNHLIAKPNEVTSILNYSDKKKYIGTIEYLYEFSPQTKAVAETKQILVKKLLKARNGNLLSLQSRVLKENLTSKEFKEISSIKFPHYADNFFQDNRDKLWICSSGGLLTFDNESGLQNLGKNENKILSARMVDIKQDKNNAIWMVSRGEGVIIKDGDKLTQIKQEHGLSSNMCRTIFMDSSNVVWVGTNHGLNKITIKTYNPLKYTIDTYYSENGLLTNEVNHIIKHQNKLWLAHNNGVSVVDPKNIKNNKVPPPVYITKVLINGENAETKNLNELNYSDNYITINYNGLSYKEPGNIEYKYKMEGMDTSWIHTKYTSLTFNTIQPGTYRFLIYAKNNDGYWSKAPAVFSFTISPPWWKTWMFISFEVIVGILLIGFVFQYRLNIIERRERLKTIQQTRLSNAELKALRAQMNPHFVFNAINSVQYFIMNNDPQSSQKYLSKFAKLIRYVVDNSKPAAIPLSKELEALNLYLDLESLRFENKFDHSIDISSNVDIDNIQIPSMLIQPFVENAIWHGLMHKDGIGKISISIDIKGNAMICVIEDNGIGRKKSQEIIKANRTSFHKSVGMSITQERLDIINQKNNSDLTMTVIDLEDKDGNGIGTRVELNLPFS